MPITIIISYSSSCHRRSNHRLRGRFINFAIPCRDLLGLESDVASIWRLAQRGAKAI